MIINLSPQCRDDRLTVTKSGDTLIINDEGFDFSSLPDGATIPAGDVPCPWVIGPVERVDGEVVLTLLLPHGATAPHETRFPEPITMTGDGPVPLPPYEEPTNVDA